MKLYLGYTALLIGVPLTIWGVRRISRWLDKRASTDKKWKPTGYLYRHEGYDASKAVEAARRADDLEARSRQLHVKRALGDKHKAKVTNIREVAK
jgi:hypothetical protein